MTMSIGIPRRRLLELLGVAGVSAATGGSGVVAGDTRVAQSSNATSATSLARAPLGPDQIAVNTPQGFRSLPQLSRTAPGEAPLVQRTWHDSGQAARASTLQSDTGQLRAEVLVSTAEHGILSRLGTQSVPADATLNIWAGRSVTDTDDEDDSFPRPGPAEPITVVVEKPDGSSDTLSIEPGEFGAGGTTYDLGEHGTGEGTYLVRVDDDDDGVPEEPTFSPDWEAEFTVGPALSLADGFGFDEFRLRGSETLISVLARTGTVPTDTEATVRVEHDGETVREETVTTGPDGVATVPVVPEESGTYGVLLERDGEVVDSDEFEAVEAVLVAGDPSAYTGAKNFLGGYLYSDSGLLGETTLTLRIEGEDTTVVDREVETDANGFATISYDVPEDIEEAGSANRLDVEAVLDGEQIRVVPDSISVSDGDESTLPEEPVEVDIDSPREAGGFLATVVAPGDEPSVTVTVEDENGDPVPDSEIEVISHLSELVIDVQATTTDSDGTASVTVPIPEDAPDGTNLRVTAIADTDGQTLAGNGFGSVQAIRFNEPFDPLDFESFLPAPGETTSISLQATDRQTGEPADGQHRHLQFIHDSALQGPFATIHQESGADGTDETSLTVPDDTQFTAQYQPFDAYDQGGFRVNVQVDHPGEISMPDTVTPGETVELSLDIPSDQTATGVVTITNWEPEHTFGTAVTSDEPATLAIPETADDSFPESPLFAQLFGDLDPFLPVVATAATPDGTLYGGRFQLNVEDDDDPGDTTDEDDSDDGFGPGFDTVSALASLGGVGYLLKRRLESGESPDGENRSE